MSVLSVLRGSQWALSRAAGLRLAARAAPRCRRPASKTLQLALLNLTSRRAASTAPKAQQRLAYPERLIIYHAGTPRATFLACLKLTTIFVFAFFGLIVTPAYLAADEPLLRVAGVVACGIVPLAFVAYSTSPFVAWIHLRLPPYARASRDALHRFARQAPAATPLEITTMNLVGKPRVSHMALGDLVPRRERLGMVNYVRDTSAENAARPWYMFRAVGKFKVEPARGEANNAWVWRELAELATRRNAS